MSRPLSICMTTTFYPPYSFGGDAMHVYRLTNELARRGHSVTVVHSVDAYNVLQPVRPADSFRNEPGVTLHGLESGLGSLKPLATYLSGRPALNAHALKDVFRGRFDVIHFHNISLLGGPGVLSYGDGAKVYTMNEHWLVCPMHVLWRHNREPCPSPQCLRCTLTFRRPPQLWRYTNLLSRQLENVDLFLSPSRFTIEAHRTRGFVHPIRHLPYFLPTTDRTASLPAPLSAPQRPYFLYVGRLEKLKGVQVLIERFRDYRDAELVIVGDGNYADELHRQAAGLTHVHFLGRVHPGALPSLYESAIALIVPSVGFEVFGIVILEAFAQRTPVIVHDLGALPEVVHDSGGGFVYRTDEELLGAMEQLRTNPRLRAEFGARGHDTWLERWSEDPHVDAYIDAVEEAVAARAR